MSSHDECVRLAKSPYCPRLHQAAPMGALLGASEAMTKIPQGIAISIPDLTPLSCSGVYFLYQGSVVVYVGQAVDIRRRLAGHIAEGVKVFDGISFVPCAPSGLLTAERRYIQKLRPIYNVVSNPAASMFGAPFGDLALSAPITKATFSAAEAAEFLGINDTSFADLWRSGEIRSVRIGRSRNRRYRVADLEMLRDRTASGSSG